MTTDDSKSLPINWPLDNFPKPISHFRHIITFAVILFSQTGSNTKSLAWILLKFPRIACAKLTPSLAGKLIQLWGSQGGVLLPCVSHFLVSVSCRRYTESRQRNYAKLVSALMVVWPVMGTAAVESWRHFASHCPYQTGADIPRNPTWENAWSLHCC